MVVPTLRRKQGKGKKRGGKWSIILRWPLLTFAKEHRISPEGLIRSAISRRHPISSSLRARAPPSPSPSPPPPPPPSRPLTNLPSSGLTAINTMRRYVNFFINRSLISLRKSLVVAWRSGLAFVADSDYNNGDGPAPS